MLNFRAAVVLSSFVVSFAAAVCLGQQDKQRYVQFQNGAATATFDRALALRTVEVGVLDGVEVKTEVLVEVNSGNPKKREWQDVGSHNARFFVDAPKVRVVPDKPVMYAPGDHVAIPAKGGLRFSAGSYGELTNDPVIPAMLSQTGNGNLTSYSLAVPTALTGAREFLESIGLSNIDKQVFGLRIIYYSSAKKPMTLATVTVNGKSAISFQTANERASAPKKATNAFRGNFVREGPSKEPIDLSKNNPVSALARIMAGFKQPC
jgi:hypothetical protein